jgi:hypothetical protein
MLDNEEEKHKYGTPDKAAHYPAVTPSKCVASPRDAEKDTDGSAHKDEGAEIVELKEFGLQRGPWSLGRTL